MSGPANRKNVGHALNDRPGATKQAAARGPEPVLDRAIQARIGDKLRAMYGELSEQPVPDRFVAILDRLAKD